MNVNFNLVRFFGVFDFKNRMYVTFLVGGNGSLQLQLQLYLRAYIIILLFLSFTLMQHFCAVLDYTFFQIEFSTHKMQLNAEKSWPFGGTVAIAMYGLGE